MPNDTMDFTESFNLTVLYLRSDEDLWGGLLVTLVLMVLTYVMFRLLAEPAVLRALKEAGEPAWAVQVARRKVLRFVAWLAVLVVMNAGLDFFRIGEQLSMPDQVTPYDATIYLMHAAMLVLALLAVDRCLVVVSEVYVRSPMAANRPIKGYIHRPYPVKAGRAPWGCKPWINWRYVMVGRAMARLRTKSPRSSIRRRRLKR